METKLSGEDFLLNILGELETARDILEWHKEDDTTIDLLQDIDKSIERLYNYQDELKAALKGIEMD